MNCVLEKRSVKNRKGRHFLLFLALFSLLALAACSGSSGSSGEDPGLSGRKASVSGQVLGSGGLEGVRVSAGGVATTTDASGFYVLQGIAVATGDRVVMTYEKEGYATYQRSIAVGEKDAYSVVCHLTKFDVTEERDPKNAIALADNDNRVRLALAPESVTGSGNVTVNMAVGDPSTESGREAFPGDYMAAVSAAAEPDTPLESVAFTEITIRDTDGKEIETLKKPGTVTLKLPAEYQVGGDRAGTYDPSDPDKDSVEWWSYDEKRATWIREDADPSTPDVVDDAIVIEEDGVLYAKAMVTHFSWWNADRPITEHAKVCVKIVDGDKEPLAGVTVLAEGVSYNGYSQSAISNAEGMACVTVPRNSRIHLKGSAGSLDFYYDHDGDDAGAGDGKPDEIAVWNTPGSTVDNSGEGMSLPWPITVSYDGVVSGTVKIEGSLKPVGDMTVYTSFGPSTVTDADGRYSVKVPLKSEISLFIVGQSAKTATVLTPDTPVTIDFLLQNRAPEITSLERDPKSGTINPGETVTLLAKATDPDGDAVTYAWEATKGSLSVTDGGAGASHETVWTAPDGIGSAKVTVTVTDAAGATAKESLTLLYEGEEEEERLTVTVKDDQENDKPLEGAYVVLYKADGKTIEKTIKTGADGVADFGNIDRSHARITVAAERDVVTEWAGGGGETNHFRVMETIDGVPAGVRVLYVFDDSYDGHGGGQMESVPVPVELDWSDGGKPAGNGRFFPCYGYAYKQPDANGIQEETLQFYPFAIPADKTVDLLYAHKDSTTGAYTRYGYLKDVKIPPADGEKPRILVNRDAVAVSWSSDALLDRVTIAGEREKIPYGFEPSFLGDGKKEGVIMHPMDLKMDRYFVTGRKSAPGAYVLTHKRYDTLPTNLTIGTKDFTLSQVARDKAAGTVSWSKEGDAIPDFFTVSINSFNYQGADGLEFEWELVVTGDVTTITLPDLPKDLTDWLGEADTYPSRRLEVEGADFAGISTLQEAIAQVMAGEDLLELSTEYYTASSETMTENSMETRRRSAAAEKPMPVLPDAGLGALRRK